MPKSVADLIEVEMRQDGAGVLAPFWVPVLEKGRAPRKNNTDHQLYKKVFMDGWLGETCLNQGQIKAK